MTSFRLLRQTTFGHHTPVFSVCTHEFADSRRAVTVVTEVTPVTFAGRPPSRGRDYGILGKNDLFAALPSHVGRIANSPYAEMEDRA
jgi:hypothetical protein